MSEDAAAAARRIVAEVLGQVEDARPLAGETADAPPVAGAAASAADAAVTTAAGAASDSPVEHGPETSPDAVARRIVEQVLADAEATAAEPRTAQPSAESGPPAPPTESAPPPAPAVPEQAVEVRVPEMSDRDVPVASDGIEVDVVTEVPRTSEPEATEPGDDDASAADIVRRIVSEVTAAPAEPASSPADHHADGGGDGAVDTERVSDTGRHEPTRELGPTQGGPEASSSASLETEPTREVPAPAEELFQTQRVRQQPDGDAHGDAPASETAVSVLDHTDLDDAGEKPSDAPQVDDDGGFEATVDAPGISGRYEALASSSARDSQPETPPARWLMISILGALALAVLFPMAVAALRALVALG